MRGLRTGSVLVVDDESNTTKVLSSILSEEGYRVSQSQEVETALGMIAREEPDLIITDLKMPGMDGMQLFECLKRMQYDIPVIFLTAFGTVETAVEAIRSGAYHFFVKPPDFEKLKDVVATAVEERCQVKIRSLSDLELDATGDGPVVGRSPNMLRILQTVAAIKDSASTVLVTGETGTGKELIASLLHQTSSRKDRSFIAVNCAAIPRELMESEFFGCEKGAFTGATTRRIGKFEEAAGGTILLDEVAELPPALQAKLLRVLQEREIERLGSNKKISVDFRLVTSTNRDLRAEVEAGNFREDLFYRINVIHIQIPPLRERKEDIPLFVSRFVSDFSKRENKVLSVSPKAMDMLIKCPWPGNVRELKNAVERAVVLAKGKSIVAEDFFTDLPNSAQESPKTGGFTSLKELETKAVRECLAACLGNKSKAARMLGISRKAFYKKLRDYDLDPDLSESRRSGIQLPSTATGTAS